MQNLDHKTEQTEHYLLFSRKIFLKSMFISRDTTKAQTVSHFLQKKYLNSTHTTFVRLQKKLLDKDYVMPFETSLRSQIISYLSSFHSVSGFRLPQKLKQIISYR